MFEVLSKYPDYKTVYESALDAKNWFDRGRYGKCAVDARSAAEWASKIICDRYGIAMPADPGSGKSSDNQSLRIKAMQDRDIIDRKRSRGLFYIQQLGNQAVHEPNTEITQTEGAGVLEYLQDFLEFAVSLTDGKAVSPKGGGDGLESTLRMLASSDDVQLQRETYAMLFEQYHANDYFIPCKHRYILFAIRAAKLGSDNEKVIAGLESEYKETRDFACLEALAFAGVDWAQNNLGVRYAKGEDVKRDIDTAIEWYRKAAKQDYHTALWNLVEIFSLYNGIAYRSVAEFTNYLTRLADSGDLEAVLRLADLYYYGYNFKKGQEKKKDYQSAVIWYRKAADKGSAKAQLALGDIYRLGRGVAQNYSKAMEYYCEAMKGGSIEATEKVGMMYQHGLGIPANLHSAMELYEWAAQQGSGSAAHKLGSIYAAEGNNIRAIFWYRYARHQKYGSAKDKLELSVYDTPLGKWYLNNKALVTANFDKGSDGFVELADIIFDEGCLEYNVEIALSLYLREAKKGNERAKICAGYIIVNLKSSEDSRENAKSCASDYRFYVHSYSGYSSHSDFAKRVKAISFGKDSVGISRLVELERTKRLTENSKRMKDRQEEKHREWLKCGKCYYCGGTLRLINKTCKSCGKDNKPIAEGYKSSGKFPNMLSYEN